MIQRVTILVLSLMLTTSCALGISSITRLAFVDGVLVILITTSMPTSLGFKTELRRSDDYGRSWQREQIEKLSDFWFETSKKGILIVDGKLHRTEDGGQKFEVLFDPSEPLTGIRETDSKLVALSAKMFYVSADKGANWTAYHPPLQNEGGINLEDVEIEGDRIAVCDNRGHLFLKNQSDGEWTTFGGSPLKDLAFRGGLLYIITWLSSEVKVFNGGSFENLPVEADRGLGLDGFARFGDKLFCYGSHKIFELVGDRKFKTIVGPSDELRVIESMVMVSQTEAICAKPGPSLVRITLNPPQIVPMAFSR